LTVAVRSLARAWLALLVFAPACLGQERATETKTTETSTTEGRAEEPLLPPAPFEVGFRSSCSFLDAELRGERADLEARLASEPAWSPVRPKLEEPQAR